MVKFVKVKSVTRTLFKMVNGKERFFHIDGPMFVGKEMKAGEGTQKKGPAMLCFVTDLETGEEGQFILGKVLQDIFNEDYPENSYVGRNFSITQNKVDGKGYNVYVVSEVEVEVETPVSDDSSLPPQSGTVVHPEQGVYQSQVETEDDSPSVENQEMIHAINQLPENATPVDLEAVIESGRKKGRK